MTNAALSLSHPAQASLPSHSEIEAGVARGRALHAQSVRAAVREFLAPLKELLAQSLYVRGI